MASWTTVLGVAPLLCAGCYEGLDGHDEPGPGAMADGDDAADGDDDAGSDGGSDDGAQPSDASCEAFDLSPAPMARLTRDEYVRAVRDLVGATVDPTRLGGDERLGPFAVNVSTSVSSTAVLSYRDVAEAAAVQAVTDLDALLPCEPGDTSEACVDAFVDGLGRRAFRRPLTDEEHARLVAVFEHGRDALDFAYGVELTVQALLQDPNFLYRVELGQPDPDDDDRLNLDGYEIASRMSFLLWGSIPDDALLDAAATETLLDAAGRQAYARQMLDSPRAREGIARLYTQWFGASGAHGLTKDPAHFPEFSSELAAQMEHEVGAVAATWILDDGATLSDLLLSSQSRVGAELAAFYGVEVSGEPDADGLYAVQLPENERAGLLTRAGVMAQMAHSDQTAPVLRGRFVRESILCQPMPPPPADVDDTVPEPIDGTSARERFEQHREDPACAGCHNLLDPIGFSFEHYDGSGRFRELEGGVAVDASGSLDSTQDADGEFDDALGLSALIASSDDLNRCGVRQHVSLAFGRTPQLQGADACWVEALQTQFDESGGDLAELLVAIVAQDNFAQRRVTEIAGGQ